jgi:hypothetical protein
MTHVTYAVNDIAYSYSFCYNIVNAGVLISSFSEGKHHTKSGAATEL